MANEILNPELESEFESDVKEYKQMEERVSKDFLQGVIKLGEILLRQRDKWKPKKQYIEYLDAVGRTVQAANQFIRIFEYSVTHMKSLVDVNLTNWAKLNTFLALPEPLREKLAEDVKGEDLSSDDFREKVAEIKKEEIITEEVVSDIPLTEERLLPEVSVPEEMSKALEDASLVDTGFMAKKLIDELRTAGHKVSDKSESVAEAFLSFEKGLKLLEEFELKKLPKTEYEFWYGVLQGQLTRFAQLFTK